MTWLDAMERYGSDKPDLRFGMELVDLDEVFAATEFRAFAGAETVKGICVEGRATLPRSRVDALVDRAKELGAAGLVWMRVTRRLGARVAGREVPVRGRAARRRSTRSARVRATSC